MINFVEELGETSLTKVVQRLVNNSRQKKLAFTVPNTKIEFKENAAFYVYTCFAYRKKPTFSMRFRIGESQFSFHYTVVFLRGKCR